MSPAVCFEFHDNQRHLLMVQKYQLSCADAVEIVKEKNGTTNLIHSQASYSELMYEMKIK